MIRLLARFVLNLLSSAVGLLAASALVSGFSINAVSFIIAVLIFSISTAVLGPLVTKIALTNAPYLMGGIALVTTLLGLAITDLVSDGISITGLSTWVIATLIVWVFSLLGSLLLPLFIFKKTLDKNKNSQPA